MTAPPPSVEEPHPEPEPPDKNLLSPASEIAPPMPPPRSPSPGIVITLDEIQRKAVEITERRNSMSSSARMEDEEGDEGGEGAATDEEDGEVRERTPVQKIMVDDEDVRMSVVEQVNIVEFNVNNLREGTCSPLHDFPLVGR